MTSPDRRSPSPERWAAIRATAEAALELPPTARAEFLDRTCRADPTLRDDVERLLLACERAGQSARFLAEPAAAFAAPLLEELTNSEHDGSDGGSRGAMRRLLRDALGKRYEIERELGRGGMATVYLAHDRQHARGVAIKVLAPELRASVSAERFLHEIRVTARLTHPHILPLHASGEAQGLLYYVMPYVDGESLRQRLTRERPLPIDAVVRLVREVAGALDYAHRHGVVHRDIKPENVLLEDGHAVVADFGIARAVSRATRGTHDGDADGGDDGGSAALRTQPGMALGTPAYMAPEQVLGNVAVDHRADLYALGVMAYEALAGAHPFGARAPHALLAAHLTEAPAPLAERRPDVPPALAALVMRLLAKDPAQRPQSAGEVVRELDGAGGGSRDAGRRPPRPRHRWMLAAAAAGVLLAAALGGAALRRQQGATPELSRPAPSRPAPSAPDPRPSVAVLPFANTSGEPADEHFSDGLTDELIGALGKVAGLKVAARTSAFALKGRGLGARAVADTLGVGTVLEGSVRRAGRRLKVTAQLVSALDGAVLWSETYDRETKDVFAVQEEIARAIVGALRVKLRAAGEPARLVDRATDDPAAYELYLKGRYVWNRRHNRDGMLQAIRYFEQAIARDPAYARAYAGLSDVHAKLGVFGYGRPREEFAQARSAAEKALALDSTLAEAHVSLAHILFVYDFKRDSAERVFRRAIALDPGYTFARLAFAICLQSQERFDEAIAQLDTALTIDPLSANIINVLGRVYVSARQPDRAIPALREALELDPQLDLAYQQLGHAYLEKGMPAEAIAALRRAAAMSGIRDSAHLAYAYAVTGQRAEAEKVLRELLDSSPRRYIPPFHVAMAFAGLGDADAAFAWLERGLEERASFMDGVTITHAFDPLHGDPRWGRLLRRMGYDPGGRRGRTAAALAVPDAKS